MLVLGIAVGAVGFEPAGAAAELEEVRDSVSRWVEVESTLSREAIAWKEKRALLEDLLAVTGAEVEALKGQLTATESLVDEAQKRRLELGAQRDRDALLASDVEAFLGEFENRVRELAGRMPQPLLKKLERTLARLPSDSQESTLGIAERMQTVIGILTEIQRFDSTVTTSDELLEDGDGQTREIQTLYFGLGAAFFVTPDGEEAGVGRATAEGWTWTPQSDLAKEVQAALAMATGTSREARFLSLPVAASAGDR